MPVPEVSWPCSGRPRGDMDQPGAPVRAYPGYFLKSCLCQVKKCVLLGIETGRNAAHHHPAGGLQLAPGLLGR